MPSFGVPGNLRAVPGAVRSADITLDDTIRHQTMIGWHATIGNTSIPDVQRSQAIDYLTDLGLTSFRIHPNRELENPYNDDGNPFTTNQAGFNTTVFDSVSQNWLVPLKQKIEANGEHFSLTLERAIYTNSSAGDIQEWQYRSPGEYSEWATTALNYMKNTYGITADYYGICNEPGNSNRMDNATLVGIAKTLGPWMQKAGLSTKIQFASYVRPGDLLTAINAYQNDTKLWQNVGLLTYHLYGGSTTDRSAISAYGVSKGIPTAQTEYMNATPDTLFDDLIYGNVSEWSAYTGGYYGNSATAGSYVQENLNGTSITPGTNYWQYYQVMHYVRPGAVRVDCTSTNSNVRVVAFIDDTGQRTLVMKAGAGKQTLTISGLTPNGKYGSSECISTNWITAEKGIKTADASGNMTVTVDGLGTMTLYPYAGTNLAPEIMTYTSSAAYLRLGVSSTTNLSGSVTDPELNALTYHWTIASQPNGAATVLANPTSLNTSANNLTVAGQYAFTLSANDGLASTSKTVYLNVYDHNNAPIFHPDEVHTQNPATLTLPGVTTHMTVYATDIEGSAVTYSYRIDSQPLGASATVTGSTATATISNITVSGDYVIRAIASDGTDTSEMTSTIHVWPVNLHAPYINPISNTLVNGCRKLSTTGGDVDGDVVTYWWSVVGGPGNVFFGNDGEDQASLDPLVWGDVAGSYTMKLTAIDRTLYTESTYTVDLTTVPEPASVCLLMAGGLVLLRRGRHVRPWKRDVTVRG